MTFSQYSASLGATAYELDLFGRVRSLNKQALENLFCHRGSPQERAHHAGGGSGPSISLRAPTGRTARLTRQTLAAVQSSYDLNKHSFDAGTASQLDLQTSASQVQTARANVAVFERQRAQAENALVLLIGQPLPVQFAAPKSLKRTKLVDNLPLGSCRPILLQRRPDILPSRTSPQSANGQHWRGGGPHFFQNHPDGSRARRACNCHIFFQGRRRPGVSRRKSAAIFAAGGIARTSMSPESSRLIEVAHMRRTIQSAFREKWRCAGGANDAGGKFQAEDAAGRSEQRLMTWPTCLPQCVESYLAVLNRRNRPIPPTAVLQSRLARLSNVIHALQGPGRGWKSETNAQTIAKATPAKRFTQELTRNPRKEKTT